MSPKAPSGQGPARAGLVLLSLIVVAGVANLNLSVANVALPSIGKEFELLSTYHAEDTGGPAVRAEPVGHP